MAPPGASRWLLPDTHRDRNGRFVCEQLYGLCRACQVTQCPVFVSRTADMRSHDLVAGRGGAGCQLLLARQACERAGHSSQGCRGVMSLMQNILENIIVQVHLYT